MRVEVHLFATLVSFLPPESRNGAVSLDVPDGSTVHDVASRLGIPSSLDRVTLVNGRDAEPERALSPGDVVTVFPPLMGGALMAEAVKSAPSPAVGMATRDDTL